MPNQYTFQSYGIVINSCVIYAKTESEMTMFWRESPIVCSTMDWLIKLLYTEVLEDFRILFALQLTGTQRNSTRKREWKDEMENLDIYLQRVVV